MIDPCGVNPCRNGGTCSAIGSEFKCMCPLGYKSERCEGEMRSHFVLASCHYHVKHGARFTFAGVYTEVFISQRRNQMYEIQVYENGLVNVNSIINKEINSLLCPPLSHFIAILMPFLQYSTKVIMTMRPPLFALQTRNHPSFVYVLPAKKKLSKY